MAKEKEKPQKALFWDFDGTITEKSPTWEHCLYLALGPFALRYGVTEEKLRPHLKKCFPRNTGEGPVPTGAMWWNRCFEDFSRVYQKLGVPYTLAEMCALRVRSVALCPGLYRIRKDASAVLAVCAYKGWKSYILSNNFPELEWLLGCLNLAQFFSGGAVSGIVGANKPDKAMFTAAKALAKPAQTIWMVGDNPVNDIAGAKAAGWKTAYIGEKKRTGADITVTRLSDLLAHL